MTSPPAISPNPPAEEFGFLDLATVLLRHRRRLLRWPVYGAIVAVVITLLTPRTYLSIAQFTPQSSNASNSAPLSGLAAQFGVVVPSGDATQSPDFYADLVEMPTILRNAVESSYQVAVDTGHVKGDLVALLRIDEKTRALSVDKAVNKLSDLVSVSSDATTSIVKVSVHAPNPDLAQEIAQRLLDLVNDFNLQSRQTQAGSERRFVESRLQQARADLLSTEDSLQEFLQANRNYSSSPSLVFRHDRMQQSVDMRQSLVSSLAQSFERARIDEVRNTALITVVEAPVAPVKSESRGGLLKVVLGLVLGAAFATGTAFIREFYASASRTERDKVAEFEEVRAAFRQDLSRLRRRLLPFARRHTPVGLPPGHP